MEIFDIDRVHWEKGKFKPWYLKQNPVKLHELKLNSKEELILIEISGQVFGFLLRELIYHHIIQGQINDVNFIVTFCGVCNAGVVLSPMIDNKLYHFREIGVYNGQQISEDIETHTLWNHLTGEALSGELKGTILNFIGSLNMTTFEEQLKINPNQLIYISGQKKIYRSIMRFVIKVILGKRNKNWLPPHFKKTLAYVDNSLPKMTMGLAVKIKDSIKFYPFELIKNKGIKDTLDGDVIDIKIENEVPKAKTIKGEVPFQLFTRWYAFILTYPKGELYKNDSTTNKM